MPDPLYPALPQVVRKITAQRLERRSPEAQRLAQVAAIAGESFSLELAAFVLDTKPLELQATLEELETAQILQGERFQHDLLLEAVLGDLSAGSKRFLNRRCAEYLSETSDPGRVARHWLEEGEEARAVPLLRAAAERSKEQLQFVAASGLFKQAGQVLERLGRRSDAFEAYCEARDALFMHSAGEDLEAIVQDMKRVATSLKERVAVAFAQTELYLYRQDLSEAMKFAQRGLRLAQDLGENYWLCVLEDGVGTIYFYQGKFHEAAEHLAQAVHFAERNLEAIEARDDRDELPAAQKALAVAYSNFTVTLEQVGNYSQAEQGHRRMLSLFNKLGEQQQALTLLGNLAINVMEQGRGKEALELFEEGLDRLNTIEESSWFAARTLNITSVDGYLLLDKPMQALSRAKHAVRFAQAQNDPALPLAQARLAQVWHTLGEVEVARELFDLALQDPNQHPIFSLTPLRLYTEFLYDSGEDTSAQVARLEGILQGGVSFFRTLQLQVLLARLKPDPKTCHDLAHKALEQASSHGIHCMVISAHTRMAATLLGLNKPQEALEHTHQAIGLLGRFDCETPRAEVLWVHYRALFATEQVEEAASHLNTSWQWLESVTQQIAPEYRRGYLQYNPFNRALFEAVQSADLDVQISQ